MLPRVLNEYEENFVREEEDEDEPLPPIRGDGLDLEAKLTTRKCILGESELVPPDCQSICLAFEVCNANVDRNKLAEGGIMRLVNRIATAPSKGREKRQVLVSASNDFPLRAAPNPATAEYTEVGRTEISVEDACPTFAIPIRVNCRKSMDRLIRIQLLWSSHNIIAGSESVLDAILCMTIYIGYDIIRFSELHSRLATLQPYTFGINTSACSNARIVIWPPFVFRRRKLESSSGPTAAGSSKGRRSSRATNEPADADNKLPSDDLLSTRETALEGRFSYQVAALVMRPFVRELEGAVTAWHRRYDHQRITQGYFVSDTEACRYGRVSVRLTVVEAQELPLASEETKGSYFTGLASSKAPSILSSVSQQAHAALTAKLTRNKTVDRIIACHPFVGVSLERPRPEMGVMIGQTNTEYSTQCPLFGSNVNLKLCPHKKPRQAFGIAGSTRLARSPDGVGQAFIFYIPKGEVDKATLHLQVFQEVLTRQDFLSTQLSGSTKLLLDSKYSTTKAGETDPELWLPLLNAAGVPAGRLLVRVAIQRPPAESPENPFQCDSPALQPSGELQPCYTWMRQAGLSGCMPRCGDLLREAASTQQSEIQDKVVIQYPIEWLREHTESLTRQLQVLQSSLRIYEQAAMEGRGFRSSALKMVPELQGVPTNVHSQTFVVADTIKSGDLRRATSDQFVVDDLLGSGPSLSQPASVSSASSNGVKTNYYDLVSSGVPAAHALGFKHGGLLSNWLEIHNLQEEIDSLDRDLHALAAPEYTPTGPTGEVCEAMSSIFQLTQSQRLPTLALSPHMAAAAALRVLQALGIACTSLATKLDIMLTEDADQGLVNRTAANIRRAGYLVCFQGLVSTIGKEMGMLEDAAMGMELLSQYSFELRCKPTLVQEHRSPSISAPPINPSPGTRDLLDFSLPVAPSLSQQSTIAGPTPPSPPVPPTSSQSAHSSLPNNGGIQSLVLEFNAEQKRVCLLLEEGALNRLPDCLRPQDRRPIFPIVALLFAQGIDAKQTLANISTQIKPSGSTTPTGSSKAQKRGNSTLQPVINRRSFKILNDYCHRCCPVECGTLSKPSSAGPLSSRQANPCYDRLSESYESTRVTLYGSPDDFTRSIDEILVHPLLEALRGEVTKDDGSHKNVELLHEQERAALEVGGGQVIFCKSGKDRTGMAVTLLQARVLGDRHGCGSATERLLRDANVMRTHGTRLLICDKNVGRLKYAFNSLQINFMPFEYRPPSETIEDMVASILNRDVT